MTASGCACGCLLPVDTGSFWAREECLWRWSRKVNGEPLPARVPAPSLSPQVFSVTDLHAAIRRIGPVEPSEPVKLTQEQLDALRAASPAPSWRFGGQPAALGGVPIELVETVEESTPFQRRVAGANAASSQVASESVDLGGALESAFGLEEGKP